MTAPDVPAHDTPLTVRFDGARCQDCGRTSNPPRHAVADFPDPTSDDPRDRFRCVDCYAALLVEATPLAEPEAPVLALELAGYDHGQIRRAIGRSMGTVEARAEAVRDAGRDDGSAALAGVLGYL